MTFENLYLGLGVLFILIVVIPQIHSWMKGVTNIKFKILVGERESGEWDIVEISYWMFLYKVVNQFPDISFNSEEEALDYAQKWIETEFGEDI